MNESFFVQTESGGTVLSTNWDEISKQKTECKPPDVCSSIQARINGEQSFRFIFQGMEWKSYND